MSIYECKVCSSSFSCSYKFSKHITNKHFRYVKEYYDIYVKKDNEGKCSLCDKNTKFKGLFEGYLKECCRSCSAIAYRKRLKENPEKFDLFSKKVSENQSKIWKQRELTGEKYEILDKAHLKAVQIISKYNQEDRLKKFSRYHTMTEDKIEELNEKGRYQLMKLLKEGKTGYHNTLKGNFQPKYPEKYKGDPTNIIFRSSYELRVMKYLDENSNVIEWRSEEIAIPYKSPIDNRLHRYFPDFLAKIRRPDGSIQTLMLEVKPYEQTKEPKVQKKRTKKYITEVTTWAVNDAKWKAARELCADKGWEFRLITEKEIFGKNK